MERLTKLALALWVGAAIALQIWILHFSWPALTWMTAGAIAGMALLAWFDRRSVAVVLAGIYLFPALTVYVRGLHSYYYDALWMAALFGALLPDLLRGRWRLPPAWRAPLVYSALVVAFGASVVVLREIDLHPLLLTDPDVLYWKGGLHPSFPVRWALHVSLTTVIGILWFDWLQSFDGEALRRAIVPPLFAGALVAALVSVYQLFVDDGFLNDTVFRNLGRTTGTLFDGNVAGMVAALWIGGVWQWAEGRSGWRRVLAIVATVVFAVAVWGSGSRTALLTAAGAGIGLGVTVLYRDGRFQPRRAIWVALAAMFLAIGVAVYGASSTRSTNPVGRMMQMLASHPSPVSLLAELWNRNGYGIAAGQMVRESPLAGVGVGSFHGMVVATAQRLGISLTPDNAQNWIRHQIAELGFVGAVGWMIWSALLVCSLVIPSKDDPSSIWTIRSVLLAFGIASLLGMPGQDPAIAFTFWVLVLWYTRLRPAAATAPRPLGAWVWAAMVAGLVVFVAASTVAARGPYRLSERARIEKLPFAYGLGPIFGAGPETDFRSVSQSAVALVDVQGRWLTVKMHLREGGRPADVRVAIEGAVMMKGRLTNQGAFVGALPVHQLRSPLLLELSVEPEGARSWWPFSSTDTEVMLSLEFADDVPAALKVGRPVREKE